MLRTSTATFFLAIGTIACGSDIARADRLDDGTILVADGESRQLRLFDANGRLVKKVGRSGRGPEEFVYVEDMELCGEEVWVLDGRRVSVWSRSLDYKREFRSEKLPMWPFTCFGGAGVLVKEDIGICDPAVGVHRRQEGECRRTWIHPSIWPQGSVCGPRYRVADRRSLRSRHSCLLQRRQASANYSGPKAGPANE